MRIPLALTLVAAVLGTATPALASPVDTPPAWLPCTGAPDPRQECATVPVPLDYRDPGGPQISIAVSRISTAAPATRRGVLLLIPGGPGNSGLNRPSTFAARLPREVLDTYDLIGFDPRGVGRSTPVGCGLSTEDADPADYLSWPGPGGDISRNVDRSRRVAAACAANGGPLIRQLTTRNAARDLDRIRRALGERKLSYWGVSYGTYVGAVYATMFPGRTDRVVLDSSDDPDPRRVARGWLANFAVGAEDRFPDFAAWAAARDESYRLGDTPAAVRDAYLKLADKLDREPLPGLTGNNLRMYMFTSLYSNAGFPVLAQLMQAARASAPLPAIPVPAPAQFQNFLAAFTAIGCNDVAWPRDVRAYAGAVAANRRDFPLTAGMPVNVFPCAFWPYRPAEPATRITPDGPANILMVQNLRDPATPHSAAVKMRDAFGGRARMVSVDAGGHGAYVANGNACGDRAVTAFLADGVRPARDLLCRS